MNSSKGNIVWKSKTVLFGKRVYLFCIGNKCMSGRVTGIKHLNNADEFEIVVEFIQPDYFSNELISGDSFTMNEASKILGKGKWKVI